MKKIFVFVLVIMLLQITAFSQVKLSGLTTMFGGNPTDEAPVLAIATSSADDVFQTTGTHDGDFTRSLNLKGMHNESITLTEVFDTTGAYIFVVSQHGLPEGKFEYRVLKNASEVIVPWTAITSAEVQTSMSNTMTYLRNLKTTRGNYLVIDLRKKGADSVLSTAVISFRATGPTITNIFLGDEMKGFMKKLTDPDWSPDSLERKKWESNYRKDEADTNYGLPKKLVLDPDQNSLVFYLKEQIRKGELLEYQLIRNGKVVTDWKKNDFDNGFVWLTNLPPGEYELKMRFTIQRENITSYRFLIKERWDQTLTFKLIAGGLIAAFFGFLFLLYRSRRQRQKLRWTKLQKEKAETELRSVYSQLNPHFIFNSLSSIQGLINKNDTESANHYLSTFSRLLRESLVNSEKDHVPLSAELKTMETYLQLEQLRFHFDYSITVDETIAVHDVEIPALLLQPLIENAIKHGVSILQEKGRISIQFTKRRNDLVALITDNGSGFDTSLPAKGFGWKLTRERIRLLNEADKEHAIVLSIASSAGKGTEILVEFKNRL